MSRALRFVHWELLNILRQVRAAPLGTASLVLGVPFLILLYGGFGAAAADALERAWRDGGASGLAAQLRVMMRYFTGIVILAGGGTMLGSFLSESSRQSLERCRRLPLTGIQVYLARRLLDEGQMVVALIPLMGVIVGVLAAGGLPGGVGLAIFFAPFIVLIGCQTVVRAAVLVGLRLFRGGRLGWRSLLLVVILVLPFTARPMTRVARVLSEGSGGTLFLPTDWIGSTAEAFLSGRTGEAWFAFFAALAIGALSVPVDFAVHRFLVVRDFDGIGTTVSRTARGRPGFGALWRLLDRLPARAGGVRLRALARTDLLRVAQDPVLAFSLLVPWLAFALAFTVAESILGEKLSVLGAEGPAWLSFAARATVGAGAALVFAAGAVLPSMLVPWEGPRLGGLRAAPAPTGEILAGKACTAAILAVGCSAVAALAAALVFGGRLPAPAVVAALLPFGVVAGGTVTAILGVALGALFPNHRAVNPLFSLTLMGMGFYWTLAVCAWGSILLAGAMVVLFGPAYALFAAGVLALWGAVGTFVYREAARGLERARAD